MDIEGLVDDAYKRRVFEFPGQVCRERGIELTEDSLGLRLTAKPMRRSIDDQQWATDYLV